MVAKQMGAEPKEEAKGELTISILRNPFTVLRRLYLSSCTIRDMKGHCGKQPECTAQEPERSSEGDTSTYWFMVEGRKN